MKRILIFTLLLFIVSCTSPTGFVVDDSIPSPDEIETFSHDPIPALNNPDYVYANDANILDTDLVLGVVINTDAHAYPISIMNFHNIVNDYVGGRDVVVSYCSICKSGAVFSREVAGRTLAFRNSGSLYQDALVLEDRETRSLWSLVTTKAIDGPYKGQTLQVLASEMLEFKDWKEKYPDTKVLSPKYQFQ